MAIANSTKALGNWGSRKSKKKNKRAAAKELKVLTFDQLSPAQKDVLLKRIAIQFGFIQDDD